MPVRSSSAHVLAWPPPDAVVAAALGDWGVRRRREAERAPFLQGLSAEVQWVA